MWIIAYLCVGYVNGFSNQPDLEKAGWLNRLPFEQPVHYEWWGIQLVDDTVVQEKIDIDD